MIDVINNRYRIVRELGRGGMGTVYLVEDTLNDDQVLTLKMIRSDLFGERNLAQFKYEFAALGQLHHPNLVVVYDFDVVAGGAASFYTMEYVPGEDLLGVAERHAGSGDYTWLYEITVQVCRALQYIHSRGLIHYDVKPRNIRITPDGQVKLMDFGLIGEARGEGQLRVRGTPEYIAPELIRGDQVDHRADLYSLGVSLYEIAAGRLPFTADSSMLILRQHVEVAPDPPRQFVESVPEALQTLILNLLSKEPAARYGSANEVVQAINQLTGLDFPVETKETKRGYIQSGNFVGREFELARLQGLLMRVMQGQGRLVLVSGAAGVGKTRLVREVRLRAQMQRVLVCEGVCHEQVRAPYRPWVSIFSQVISYQRTSSPDVLQVYGLPLVKLMPDLAEHIGLPLDTGEEVEDRYRLMEAAARFLMTCDRPLMLVLDDLQYADAETIELLDYLGRRARDASWLVCGVYRSYDVDETHPVNALVRRAQLISRRQESQTPTGDQPYDLVQLDALDETAAGDFVASMLGVRELPEGLLPQLMAQTGGNPLFIESVMHSLVEEDLLQYDSATWHIDVANLTRIPSSIQEAAERRLGRLNSESLSLLEWAAVMGQWLDMDVLADVSGLAPERIFHFINEAVQRHVLVLDEHAEGLVYRFSTDPMRDVLYTRLMSEDRAARHRRVGEALRALYKAEDVAVWLAWHFECAGDVDLALQYERIAADKARLVYANDSAIEHYTRALKFVSAQGPAADPQVQYDLLAAREERYDLVGAREAQQADLEAMARLALEMGDVVRQVEVVTRRVALANQLGQHAEARALAEATLALAHQAGDSKLEADILTALGEARYALSDWDGTRECHERALSLYRALGDQSGEAANLRFLGRAAMRVGQPGEARAYFEQALVIWQALGDRPGEAAVLNSLAIDATDYALRRRYFEQALAIYQAMGDRAGLSRLYNNLGILYWNLGLYSRGREYLEQAVQIDRETRGRSSLAYSLESLGRIYLELGEYAQAQQVLEEGRALGIDISDRWTESTYWLMLGRVALARGRLAEARELIQVACEMQRELGVSEVVTSLAWLGATYLAAGDWESADRHSAEAVAQFEALGNAGDYPAQDVWWLRYQVLRAAPDAPGEDLVGDAAWEALLTAREVMLAGIATLSDVGLRRNYLNRVRIHNAILTEWTRYAPSRAGVTESLDALGALEEVPAEPAQVEDRLKRVLDISVRMNETHGVEPLLEYVMDQVIELTGAERGFLVLLDEAGRMDFKVARGIERADIERARSDISYTVIGTVTQSKAPVLLQDALADERFGRQDSILELNLRSVLCVPLVTVSGLIGMIYADNRSVSGRFSQSDLDLMTIFANQAAIAIENARLYEQTVRAKEELEIWARTLEQRVDERTAELQVANKALSRRAVQLEASSEVAQQLTAILDLDDLLYQVVHLIQSRFEYYFVGVWLVDEERASVSLRAGTAKVGDGVCGQDFRIAMDMPSIIVSVCQTGQYRLVNDVENTPDYLAIEWLPEGCAELALPLRMGNETVGALDILCNRVGVFGPNDRMVLQTLADQIAIAIRNAQLYKSEHQRRLLAESLEQTGRVLSSSLDMSEVPERILEQLAIVVPYGRGLVLLRQDDVLVDVARRGFPEAERLDDVKVPIRYDEDDVFYRMVRTHRPVLLDDVTHEPGWQQLDWLPVEKSWIGVPLISQDQVLGMVSLTRREAAAFSADDIMLVQAFAAQAAIALENARLYEEIRYFNEQLEQMVHERTEELDKAYQTLEQLDKTKTDFIEVAAHELRTPLTLIKGYAQVLGGHAGVKGDADAEVLLKGILGGSARLHEVVNSMLDAAKIDADVLRAHREPLALSIPIKSVAAVFEEALQERGLQLTIGDVDGLPLVNADVDLVEKVFYHLIGNAIKYTPDGGSIAIRGGVV
ncbi:MAG: GAF domain-containing protein, partial [Anaerolineae bacterium]|nr:GAF domain-containing protein [Anaerolineae bacterium]